MKHDREGVEFQRALAKMLQRESTKRIWDLATKRRESKSKWPISQNCLESAPGINFQMKKNIGGALILMWSVTSWV